MKKEQLFETYVTDPDTFVAKTPERGDHIRVDRGSYYHHGIYESDDKVYHFNGGDVYNPLTWKDAKIICTTLSEFLKGGTVEVREYSDEQKEKKHSVDEIIECAESYMDIIRPDWYSVFTNNCEAFANLCVFGKKESGQVKRVLGGAAKIAAGAAGTALLALGAMAVINKNKDGNSSTES